MMYGERKTREKEERFLRKQERGTGRESGGAGRHTTPLICM